MLLWPFLAMAVFAIFMATHRHGLYGAFACAFLVLLGLLAHAGILVTGMLSGAGVFFLGQSALFAKE